MEAVKVFCPGTIANVSCGFDVLGLCLESVGDEMIIQKSNKPGIRITKIEGANLPMETEKNVAGVAALALLEAIDTPFGFEIEIYKKIKAGSGIGSSAASAAGAVFGINELLGKPFTANELVAFAMQGEALASGAPHADNVAPALMGGCTLVRSYQPLDVISLPTPIQLYATVVHPQIEVKTADSRAILKHNVTLKKAIQQWGNVGGFVSGLFLNDYELISRSLEDVIVEPIRSVLIPFFNDVKIAGKHAGALGSGISGSGPSIFTLSKGESTALKVANAIKDIYSPTEIEFDIHVSPVNAMGCKILPL